MSDTLPVLQARGLTCRFGPIPLFEGLDFDVPAGLTVVRGGEGRGKTTLLRLLAGEEGIGSGALRVGPLELAQDAGAYRAQVFWVDPRTDIHDQRSVRELLTHPGTHWPMQDHALLRTLIEGLGLEDHLDKALYMLSTGSRRKVWLAAGLSAGARVTLFDQPFAALDAASCRFVAGQLNERALEPGRAWVIADHEVPPGLKQSQVIDLGD